MSLCLITTQAVPGKSGILCMARISGNAGVLITQATISSIQVVVTDVTQVAAGQSGAVNTYMPAVGTVVSDALQQNSGLWTKDSASQPGPDGLWDYNVAWTVPAACFANAGDRFQIDFKFQPVSGEPFVVSFLVPTLKVYTS